MDGSARPASIKSKCGEQLTSGMIAGVPGGAWLQTTDRMDRTEAIQVLFGKNDR